MSGYYNVTSHVDTVHPDDLDMALSVLQEVGDYFSLDVFAYEAEDGMYDLVLEGPRGMVNQAIEEYFNHT